MNERSLTWLQGPVVIAGAAPYGVGGLGRHLQELVEFCRARGLQTNYFASEIQNAPPSGHKIKPGWLNSWRKFAPVFLSPAWQGYLESLLFDSLVAKRLSQGNTFIGFGGQSLRSMKAARRKGFQNLLLVSATAHVNLSVAQLRKAWDYAAIEPTGYIRHQHDRILMEYEIADRILFASDYIRQSFLHEHFPESKLERFDLSADPRFKPPAMKKRDGRFRVVSIGTLSLIKGVVVLLDAFKKFDSPQAELTLVGGSGTKQMRTFLDFWKTQDPRVRVAPGDPLPHLQVADVCVHASFQDGFGYAPIEALACGVPVIVTDSTGMKECVRDGKNGFVVPTGDPTAITQALRQLFSSGLSA